MGKILVIGSSNTDLIAKVDKFPLGGETIEGEAFFQAMGGKGANQAMAAHRLGGDVNFITSLGNDTYGQNALKYYKEQGLKVENSFVVNGVSSGTAIILVDNSGENCIVVTPGANNELSIDNIKKIEKVIDESEIILLQMEIPYRTINAICELAFKKNKLVLLNAAPARPLDNNIMRMVDFLVVNETEAETISGKKISEIGEESVVDHLLKMGANTVILTLGQNGCFLKNKDLYLSLPAFKVEVKDTTGAGDTFCGSIAVGLLRNEEWLSILEFATAAAAVCVTRMGAQPSIPNEMEVKEFLRANTDLTKNSQVVYANGNGNGVQIK